MTLFQLINLKKIILFDNLIFANIKIKVFNEFVHSNENFQLIDSRKKILKKHI